ncbi:PREDICTED: uncharacterized protein LOC108360219 [Rhagoletis zephyria]|uniref:uncharacterized protein LOC108360219 n=1 Tax=Rhagoletis zephyria TaxID=28612 RepID=UPI0008114CE5|nr:PREDICTED: uncharacterized protein LOC108360219 [Rhagoletis zephyria]XP_036340977.1 uncharacterized protein LOC118750365 [Rhagoletis pomonella]
MVLSNQRPSQLFNAMRCIAGNSFSEETRRAMWIERLPEMVRASIIAREGPIDVLIVVADAVMETLTQRQICGVTKEVSSNILEKDSQAAITQLANTILELQQKIDNLSTRQRSRSRINYRRARSRSRQNTLRSKPTGGNECWYHQTFGDAATRCRSPCSHRQRDVGNSVSNQHD